MFLVPLIITRVFHRPHLFPMRAPARAPAQLILFQRILSQIKDAVQPFRGCDIWRRASQAVFSEGNCMPEVMLIVGVPGFHDLTLDRAAGANSKALQIQDQVLHIFSSRSSPER